jgi:chemotaxis protein methyltransferase CheR
VAATRHPGVITDSEGISFLQWCLPKLQLRWPGFRKVRRSIYRRLNRRLQTLQLVSLDAYRSYLEQHPHEWAELEALCRIPISRFYRDRGVFEFVEKEVLPHLANLVLAQGGNELRCWSAGCAGGEEPYTLAIIWKQRFASRFGTIHLRVIATDVDPVAIQRAERGQYQRSSLKELPAQWRTEAFAVCGEELRLKDEYRAAVDFAIQDIRHTLPQETFHLILCRNLVFTYFDETSQEKMLRNLTRKIMPGGALIIGKLETLPHGYCDLEPWSIKIGVYRKPSFAALCQASVL